MLQKLAEPFFDFAVDNWRRAKANGREAQAGEQEMPVRVDDIIEALSTLGGEAHNSQIEQVVRQIAPPPLPVDVGAVIRARIQERTLETDSYKGGEILFESVHGVRARKGVWRLVVDPLRSTDPDGFHDPAETEIEAEEWRAKLRIHLRRERSRSLVAAFKERLEHFHCYACGFDFEAAYGELGSRFIEAHHAIPVADLQNGQKTKLDDLVPLCANCHRMVHRGDGMSANELKDLVAARKGQYAE